MRRIGDVCDVIPGFAFKSEDFGETGVPVIKIGNITENHAVDIASTQCIPVDLVSEKHKKFFLRDGDFLIAMTGATAGKVGRIRCPEDQFFLLNQRVAKLSPKAINPDFFWFTISTDRYRTLFYGLGGGAAQPSMSGSQMESVEIPCRPTLEQEHIASTLTAYDDLIENNRRRIREDL
jgi:type I restriction enzyme S subunit